MVQLRKRRILEFWSTTNSNPVFRSQLQPRKQIKFWARFYGLSHIEIKYTLSSYLRLVYVVISSTPCRHTVLGWKKTLKCWRQFSAGQYGKFGGFRLI